MKKTFILAIACALITFFAATCAIRQQGVKDPVTGMEFVFVKGGCYEMGDTFGDGWARERPVHEACVDDFYIGKYAVTIGEFRKFVNDTGYRTEAETGGGCYFTKDGNGKKDWEKDSGRNWRNPGFPQDDRHPVVCTSWNDAKAFAEWQVRKSGKAFRLPTEAEWEYAARSGGKRYKYSWGNRSPSGNIADESLKRVYSQAIIWEGYDDSYVHTAPAGSFRPNKLGLYDMAGNVWQWTADWYGEKYYIESSKDNPQGPDNGEYRAIRGSCWRGKPANIRASFRYRDAEPYICSGFRMVVPAR